MRKPRNRWKSYRFSREEWDAQMQNMVQLECEKRARETDRILEKYLPVECGYQKTVIEAMNYSIRVGGKRLRPILMQEIFQLLGGQGRSIEPFMAAIEMIHTYSLVHDDLPAMDNDMYRRGKKTTHAVYGEAMGILAGDGLLNYAFEVIATSFMMDYAQDPQVLTRAMRAMQILSGKAGIYGMIGGQCADIEFEMAEEREVDALHFIHEKKTAALIQAAMMVGACMAGADQETMKKIEKCAYNIGIAFQIQDDILDIIGDSKELGKSVGSDEKNNKMTYVSVYGLEKAQQDVKELSREAIHILREIRFEDKNQEFLEELILSLTTRRK